MIIPQSFQFVGQIVWLFSLQNVFQMTPLALKAHLQVVHKIVSDMTVVHKEVLGSTGATQDHN